jgi:hypothetical protein
LLVYVSLSYPVPYNSALVLQELSVPPKTQTWIHLMSSITNHRLTKNTTNTEQREQQCLDFAVSLFKSPFGGWLPVENK